MNKKYIVKSSIKQLKQFSLLLLLLMGFNVSAQTSSVTNSDLFEKQKTGLFVIQSVDITSGNKTSVGSGFRLSESGLLASNYHVVSDHVLHPDEFELQFVNSNDEQGEVKVVAVDVINDLALLQVTKVLEADNPAANDETSVQTVIGSRLNEEEVADAEAVVVLSRSDIDALEEGTNLSGLLENLQDIPVLKGQIVHPKWVFELAYELPLQGDDVIAMGNPYDIGLSLVPGIFNGITSKGFKKNIHFTGALNPGMSGGPAVDREGKVVGVNVAGAGNSVSFLVPVEKLSALLERYQNSSDPQVDMRQSINNDLLEHQAQVIDDLLSEEWQLEAFGPLMVPMEIRDYVDCSAATTGAEDGLSYEFHSSDCGVHDRIYLSRNFDTGTVEFDYGWYKSEVLNTYQFYKIMEGISFSAFNRTSIKDVTTFSCHQDVQQFPALDPVPFQSTFCVRTYTDYNDMYDVLFYAKSLLDHSEGVYLHYTLAGVSKAKADAFNERFVGAVQWK